MHTIDRHGCNYPGQWSALIVENIFSPTAAVLGITCGFHCPTAVIVELLRSRCVNLSQPTQVVYTVPTYFYLYNAASFFVRFLEPVFGAVTFPVSETLLLIAIVSPNRNEPSQ